MEAVRLYQRALHITEAVFGPAHPGLVRTLLKLGDVHSLQVWLLLLLLLL